MQGIVNVSAESLVQHAGVQVGQPQFQGAAPEFLSRLLKTQLGILQTRSRQEQLEVHCEVAARYLPELVHAYRMCTGPINPPMTLLNVISYTSYFIRFLKTPEGYDITTLQAHRTAQEAEYMSMLNATEVGEAGQFLSTLLLLQGAAAVADEDRNILIPKLRQWQRSFNGLASDVSERCLAILTDDP
ncbi:hypothetical protein HGRIS_001939 [Hohenbuehelia grisea]|uniref:Uncharacterized protein n=1 Tax=Hohenbuehelia grisea TaxID=104357 RepID=A0ABR3JJ37_9AGAR